ncbi:MAG: SPOR domain-containing protein [Bacteroidales bacterium]|nr:SPOR domain-containing protein [Bacteroidales bacterium]
MKKVFFLILIVAFSIQLKAQDLYSPISDFSDSELEIIKDAQKDIERGDRMAANADNDYEKYKDLLTSDKKAKQKKGEKKTVQAKRNLLSGGTYFNKGYKALYDLYSEKLSTIVFKFPEDQQKADNLKADADKAFSSGETLLAKNNSYTDKQLEKDVKFKSLQSSIVGGAEKEKEAIEKLAEALGLYENQTIKENDLNQKDNEAWQEALMENSISAFEKYLDSYPNGLHIAEAQQKIDELEEKIRIAEQQQNNPELVYHVQIMADTHQWTNQEIKSKIYYTTEPITETYVDGWYKYWIGSFNTYDEAKAKAKQVKYKRKKAFVVGTINGQPVDILQALEVENKNK